MPERGAIAASIARLSGRRIALGAESLALALSLWFTGTCNLPFWRLAMDGHAAGGASAPAYALALATLMTALHFVLLLGLATVLPGRAIKPAFAALAMLTGVAAYYMRAFHVYLDPEMLRNVLHTDTREALELLSPSMLPALALHTLPPLALIGMVDLKRRSLAAAAVRRSLSVVAAVAVAAIALFYAFQDLSAFMRAKKEARYLITPANYLYSTLHNVAGLGRVRAAEKSEVGGDARRGAGWQQRTRPVLFVVVVGETARAANWGLSGYARQTTPRLAALDVINFPTVTACGTSTEVSVPCMLSPFGRHAYDEKRIRSSESLPQILKRSGMRVAWLDNQSGCKGVCDGLETWKPDAASSPADCSGGSCFDGALVSGVRRLTGGDPADTVLFLHMMGNHGPAYARRYPPEFRRFSPTCETADLGRCARDEIVNAYDNALLYTDEVLGRLIEALRELEARYDTAMVYVSDHGESLGENRMFLHGVPYAIAPDVQKEVPMVMWFSAAFRKNFSLDAACLARRAAAPAAHDHLFHSVLGLLDIDTAVRDSSYDLAGPCRKAPLAATAAFRGDRY